jgi:hypothetical protein
MKTALAVLLAMFVVLPVAADDRAVKEQLVAELLELLDVRRLTAANFDVLVGAEDHSESTRTLRERVLPRLDYSKVGEELYAPLFRDNFSSDELRELIAFYRTRAGQKSLRILPDLSTVVLRSSQRLSEMMSEVQQEIESEEIKARPELAAMKDMRIIATCLEARATDTNEYPKVAFEELPPLLEPVYVRVLPRVDPWGTAYAYVSDGQNYRVVSAGADKRFAWDSRRLDLQNVETRPMGDLEADLIFQNGSFIQFPARANGR